MQRQLLGHCSSTESKSSGFEGELRLGTRTFNMLPMEFLSLSIFRKGNG